MINPASSRIVLALSLVLGASAAFAGQGGPADGLSGLSVKVGLFVPVTRDSRDAFGNTGLIGAEYAFSRMTPTVSGLKRSLSISVEAWGRDDYGSVPVTLNYNIETFNRLRFSAGIGLAAVQAPFSGGGIDRKVRLAYGLSAAYILSPKANSFFVEAKFLGNGDTDLSGFAFSLGYRF